MKEEKNTIINSWEKLTVGKYMELKEVLNDKEVDNIDRNLAITSILTGIDVEELYYMPATRFNRLFQNSAFLQEECPHTEMKSKYKIGEYTCRPVYELGKLSTAQFVDYQTFIKDIDKYLPELLAVFLIPEGNTYTQGYDLDDLTKSIKMYLPINEALTLSAFFLVIYRSLLITTLSSLRRQIKKLKKQKMIPKEKIEEIEKQMKVLEENGAGYL